jgi:hypothetical protein
MRPRRGVGLGFIRRKQAYTYIGLLFWALAGGNTRTATPSLHYVCLEPPFPGTLSALKC